jgi:N2-citryl-N6-acetyl-N6-hydroxylysine synthase
MNFEMRATTHASSCFFNSLFREWSNYTFDGHRIILTIDESTELAIGLSHYSQLGRHEYNGDVRLNSVAIDFETAVERISARLARDYATPPEDVQKFIERVLASRRNIQLSLERKTSTPRLHFRDTEQGLLVGHNFHPTPKSRDEFSDEDMRRYSPEFGGSFALQWLMAVPEVLHQSWSHSFQQRDWTHELALEEGLDLDKLKSLRTAGYVPLPMHPWQWQILLKSPHVQKLVASKKIISLEPSRELWSATSSLRSLYREHAPYMLKFSMSVKLTNSIRHLLTHEVERGLQLHDVLATAMGQEFLANYPQFHVVTEPAFIAIKGEDGAPLCETIVVCRQNPFRGANAENKVVLATLTQDSPLAGPSSSQNLIRDLIASADDSLSLRERSLKWFELYLETTVKPLVAAQADYGIILGAHQQNLVIGLEGGYPVSSYFRDCQGTGYSELGFRNFAHDVPLINRENGNVVTELMANSLFAYYLILNSTFNVITALSGSEDFVSETELLGLLRLHLEEKRSALLQNPADHDLNFLNYLLDSEKLMHKGNFLCAFTNLNENTTSDPLAIYTPVANSIQTSSTGQNHA